MRRKKGERLTVKEEKFVRELVRTGNATDAALASYDVKDRAAAREMAKVVLKRPQVDAAIAEWMRDVHPTIKQDTAALILRGFNAPIKGSPEDDGSGYAQTWSEKRAFIELAAKFGGFSPKASEGGEKVVFEIPSDDESGE